jgi:hypothetical protein
MERDTPHEGEELVNRAVVASTQHVNPIIVTVADDNRQTVIELTEQKHEKSEQDENMLIEPLRRRITMLEQELSDSRIASIRSTRSVAQLTSRVKRRASLIWMSTLAVAMVASVIMAIVAIVDASFVEVKRACENIAA